MIERGMVRVELRTPMAFHSRNPVQPVSLDGILGIAWMEKQGIRKTSAEILPEELIFPELPLSRAGDKVYMASMMFVPESASYYPETLVRTTNNTLFLAKQCPAIHSIACPNDQSGYMKGHMENFWLLATPYVDFYYTTENPDEFRSLLSFALGKGSIGGRIGAGFGKVKGCRIWTEKDGAKDWSIIKEDGTPTRPLPVRLFEGKAKAGRTGYVGVCPPYWHPSNKEECFLPPDTQYLPRPNFKNIEDIFAEKARIVTEREERFEKLKQEKAGKAKTNKEAKAS